jgi:diguanylate cyclase (GGDEF)-like protein
MSVFHPDDGEFAPLQHISYPPEMIDNSAILSQHRARDFIARWRVGDEFLVLLPATTTEGAFVVAERLRSQVESTSRVWKFPITISIGLSTYPSHGTTIKELLLAVEKAAKHSKEHGKNQITAFERAKYIIKLPG